MENSLGLYIVGAFLLVNLLLGLWAGRGTKTVEDYTVGKKKWSTGSLVMTYLATGVGGELIFRDLRDIYDNGIAMLIALMGIPISHFVRAYFLSKRLHEFQPAVTTADFIGVMYGKKAEIFTGLLSFVYGIAVSALQIKCLGIIFESFFNIDPNIGLIISGFIITAYTASGGMRAVVATDIFQLGLIFIAIYLILYYTVPAAGGLINIFKEIPHSKINLFERNDLPLYSSFFILDSIFSWEMAESARFQRFLMADNSKKLKKVLIYSGIGSVFVIIALGLIAIIGIELIDKNFLDQKNLTCTIISTYIPNYIRPIVVLGLLSVIFSSGDSWIHSTGISLGRNFIQPVTNRHVTLGQTKVFVLIGGILSTFFSIKGEFLFFRFEYLLAMVGPILAPAILYGLICKKTYPNMFFYSALISFLTFLSCKFIFKNLGQWALLLSTISSTFCLFYFFFWGKDKK